MNRRKDCICYCAANTVSSEHPDAYIYADTNGLLWDNQFKYWTKDSWAGDYSSSHLSDSCATLPTLASTTSLNDSPVGSRAATPEHLSRPVSRPLSGISFRSDDLKTIPSEEVNHYCCRKLKALSCRVPSGTTVKQTDSQSAYQSACTVPCKHNTVAI